MTWYEAIGAIASIITIVEFAPRLLGCKGAIQRIKDFWSGMSGTSKNHIVLLETGKPSPVQSRSQSNHSSVVNSSHIRDRNEPVESKVGNFTLTEERIGILRSKVTNYPVRYEILRFRGKLTAEVFLMHAYGSTLQRLYETPDGKYLVYVERDHRHDYWTSCLAGAMVDGEFETPLSLSEVQDSFPELATEADICRVTDV